MGEPQLFESTIVSGTPTLVNGVEVQNSDIALLGQTAGLADDRVLAELLRIPPFVSVVAKAILPYTIADTPFTPGTVMPTGSANGSVSILPFRAVVGSRTSIATNALNSWRDIRSGIFIPPGNATLNMTQPISANSSGNPRWDLVYATLTVDAPTNQVQRRVKDPSTSNQSIVSVYQYLSQPVTIAVQAGTPAATPTIPALPADSGSSYNIPLAAVRVPNGFGPTTTVLPSDIRDQAPLAPLANSTGATTVRPANGNNDGAGTYATDAAFQWPTTSAANRSPVFLPPTLLGGEQLIVEIDAVNSAHPSHANGSIVDNTVDWRNRFFLVFAQLDKSSLAFPWANDPSGAGVQRQPLGSILTLSGTTGTNDIRIANSFWGDAFFASGQATLYTANNAQFPSIIPGGASVGVYVDMSTGAMKCALSATSPTARLFLWIMSSAQFPNF